MLCPCWRKQKCFPPLPEEDPTGPRFAGSGGGNKMKNNALVLESVNSIVLPWSLGSASNEVWVAIKAVGICGSDVHHLKHGSVGDFIVDSPTMLGHEASDIVTAMGAKVSHLKVGDRVCMEPGMPDFGSRQTLESHYNLDPAGWFWSACRMTAFRSTWWRRRSRKSA